MIDQLKIMPDGSMLDKVEIAIQRLKTFEPPEGYYVAFSGGKDSQCVYHLCKEAGVKFDAHYHLTSVEPPELVRFIRRNYPDVIWDSPRNEDGKRISMWSLIPQKRMPPTRAVRYCCKEFKEVGGKGRLVVTGVRWAESVRRKNNQGLAVIQGKPKRTQTLGKSILADFRVSQSGGVVLNDDNDISRRMVEQCYRTQTTLVNPIVDWDDADVWEFLNSRQIPHCELYDDGFSRIGCIGCPMQGPEGMRRDFARWPKYKTLYLKAFARMLAERRKAGLDTEWQTVDDVMQWWLGERSRKSGGRANEP